MFFHLFMMFACQNLPNIKICYVYILKKNSQSFHCLLHRCILVIKNNSLKTSVLRCWTGRFYIYFPSRALGFTLEDCCVTYKRIYKWLRFVIFFKLSTRKNFKYKCLSLQQQHPSNTIHFDVSHKKHTHTLLHKFLFYKSWNTIIFQFAGTF